MQKPLNTSTTKNISYSAIGKVVAFLFQACANVILSRELVSSDYGIVNFAMIQVALMTTLSSFGINNAAIQRKEFNENTLYTAFTIKLLFSLVVYAFLYITAGLSVCFFDDPNVVKVIRFLATVIVINTFAFMSCTVLSRKLELKKIVIAETANTVASSVIAIIMALSGFKFWSIATAYVCSNVVFVLLANYFQPCRISFRIDRQIASELIRYGYSVLLASLVSFAVFNFDNFVVGSVRGASTLGYYALAFNWGSMVCGIMSSVVLSVLFPTFSRMQDDPVKMKAAYLEVIRYTAIFCVLWNLTLFSVADGFLVLVLGKGTDKWLPALNTLRILCVYGVVRSLIEPVNTLLMASGNPRLVLKSGIVVAVFELLLVYPAIRFGSIEVVGAVVLSAYMSQIYFIKKYVRRVFNVGFADVVKLLLPVCSTAIIVYIFYYGAHGFISNSFIGLILSASCIAITYIIVYGFLTGWKYYSRIYGLVRNW
jgi:O-antigen/teichoic acid export membrane protein